MVKVLSAKASKTQAPAPSLLTQIVKRHVHAVEQIILQLLQGGPVQRRQHVGRTHVPAPFAPSLERFVKALLVKGLVLPLEG